LLYIDAKLYEENLAKEKQVIAIKEISFLQQSFFFADINLQTFEKKYFNYFIIEDKLQGEVLCSENDVINEIYFIRKGIISLYSTKSPIEIHNFLYTLAKNNPNHQSHRGIQYSPLKTNIRELKKELLKKRFQRLFDVNNSEINEFLGWCYEYNIGVDRDADKSKKYLKAAELIKEVIKD
jgi:TPR repeat protein